MPRPVGDEFYERRIRRRGSRLEFVEYRADALYEVYVRPLVISADVIRLSPSPFMHDGVERFTVIIHVKPVPYVLALSVHGNMIARRGVQYDDGDEFFGKLIRAVVIRAMSRYRGKPVGLLVGP